MKVVVNKCYGGFGLSDAVHKELIKLGVPYYKKWEDIPKNSEEPYVVDSDSSSFGNYYDNFGDDEKRSHPLLIKAIETVGIENASGSFSRLKIVEIPDDISFEIDDYDGIETIREHHRSW